MTFLPAAAFLPLLEFEIASVGYEVGVPNSTGIRFPLAAEIFGVAVEPVSKVARRVKDKIGIMEEIENDRHAIHGEKPRRLVARAIEMLIPGIERQGEKTPLLPIKGLLRAPIIPNGCCAPAFEDINHVFIEMPLGIEGLPRRNLAHVSTGRSFRAFHVDERTIASGSVPWF